MNTMVKGFVSVCIVIVLVVIAGCTPSQSVGEEFNTPTEETAPSPPALEEESQPTQTDEPIQPMEAEEENPAETVEPTFTETPEEESLVEATEQPEIEHKTMPQKAVYFGKQIIFECNTGYNFASSDSYRIPRACDSWRNNLLERPVSQDLQTFYPYLDILNAMAGYDPEWYFISFTLFDSSNPTDGTPFHYFVEIDKNFDGRGDYLVVVENLTFNKTDWTVDGLTVWQDTNKDVGSFNAVLSDQQNAGDGYDTLIFNQGVSSDPDLVWVRRQPEQTAQIEFAVKRTLFTDKISFMWSVGTLQGELNPAAFDLVDGQADADFFGVDTTCAWPLGIDGKGFPRQCYVPEPTPVPTNMPKPKNVCVKPPMPGPYCWVWIEEDCEWVCYN